MTFVSKTVSLAMMGSLFLILQRTSLQASSPLAANNSTRYPTFCEKSRRTLVGARWVRRAGDCVLTFPATLSQLLLSSTPLTSQQSSSFLAAAGDCFLTLPAPCDSSVTAQRCLFCRNGPGKLSHSHPAPPPVDGGVKDALARKTLDVATMV